MLDARQAAEPQNYKGAANAALDDLVDVKSRHVAPLFLLGQVVDDLGLADVKNRC